MQSIVHHTLVMGVRVMDVTMLSVGVVVMIMGVMCVLVVGVGVMVLL